MDWITNAHCGGWRCYGIPRDSSPEDDELSVLVTLIDAYERKRYPIGLPDPIEAIKFRLEQQGQDTRSLIGVIGQRTRVYEVLHGKRALSLAMIRNLHDRFGIPANVLIQPIHRAKLVSKRLSSRSQRQQRRTLKRSA